MTNVADVKRPAEEILFRRLRKHNPFTFPDISSGSTLGFSRILETLESASDASEVAPRVIRLAGLRAVLSSGDGERRLCARPCISLDDIIDRFSLYSNRAD